LWAVVKEALDLVRSVLKPVTLDDATDLIMKDGPRDIEDHTVP